MIAAIGFMLAVQDQAPALQNDPGAIVSEVFKRYYYASSLKGTITCETTDGAGTKKVTTQVSYVRPDKISVKQDYKGKNGLMLSLVSDGTKFSYDPPLDSILKPKPGERLYELVTIKKEGGGQAFVHDVGLMYAAAHKSLMPSTVLDLAIAHMDHLKDFKINVRTIALGGTVDLGGQKAYYMKGEWQPYIGSLYPVGVFEIWVSMTFDVLKFRLTQPYQVNGRKVNVVTTETANLAVNAAVDEGLFVVK